MEPYGHGLSQLVLSRGARIESERWTEAFVPVEDNELVRIDPHSLESLDELFVSRIFAPYRFSIATLYTALATFVHPEPLALEASLLTVDNLKQLIVECVGQRVRLSLFLRPCAY